MIYKGLNLFCGPDGEFEPYPKLIKPSIIKGLSLYSSHLNKSKLAKIGVSS